jgi:hypothetical protein
MRTKQRTIDEQIAAADRPNNTCHEPGASPLNVIPEISESSVRVRILERVLLRVETAKQFLCARWAEAVKLFLTLLDPFFLAAVTE